MAKNNDDIFAPPSEDELNMFAEPSEDELKMFAPPTEVELDDTPPSMLESFARGGIQGASMGASDEIGAALTAPVDVIREQMREATEREGLDEAQKGLLKRLQTSYRYAKGKGDEERAAKIANIFKKELDTPFQAEEAASFGDIYTDRRDAGRAANKEAEEANPMTYLAGEVAGGVAPAVATGIGGATGLASGVKGAGTQAIKELVKAGGKQAAKETIRKEALKHALKTGATFGAADALGRSEADLTKGEFVEAAKDTAAGATLGMGMGAAMSGAGALGKAFVNKTNSGQSLKHAAGELGEMFHEAFQKSKGGDKLLRGGEGIAKKTKEFNQAVKKMMSSVEDIGKGGAKRDIAAAVGDKKLIDITEGADEAVSLINSRIKEVGVDSDDAKILNNMKQYLQNIKNEVLEDSGFDASLPKKSDLRSKFQNVIDEDIARNKLANPEAEAVDKLATRAAKMKKGQNLDQLDLLEVKSELNLPNTDDAFDIIKDVARLSDESGDKQIREIIKRYQTPTLVDEGGRLGIQRGTKAPLKSEYAKYLPEDAPTNIQKTPQELLNMRDELRKTSFGKGDRVADVSKNVDDILTNKLKSEVGEGNTELFEKGMKTYSDIYDLEDIFSGISKLDDRAKSALDIDAISEKLSNHLSRLDPGQQTEAVNLFQQKLKSVIPEQADNILDGMSEIARNKALQEVAYKSSGIRAIGTVESFGVKGAAYLGTGVKNLQDTLKAIPYAQKVGKGVSGLAKFTSDELANVSKAFEVKYPQASNFFNELSQVTDGRKKSAMLFIAMQRPGLREPIKKMLDISEQEGNKN